MDYPSICLVTACYNHEKYIAETIESVLNQNYPNLQYVLINDGSTDKSGEIIKQYAKDLYYSEDWSGYRPTVTLALNKGFQKTNAEIMGWLNSKNILLPGSLFIVADVFQSLAKVEWITGFATTIDQESKIFRVEAYRKNKYDYLAGQWSVIQQESTFWRRSLWDRAGRKLSQEILFDLELWSRFFLQADLYHVQTVLGAYRYLPQAFSLRHRKDWEQGVGQTLERMRRQVGRREHQKAKVFTSLRKYLGPLLGIIPQRVYLNFPFLSEYHYKTISYLKKEKTWKIEERNPFRPGF